MSPINAGILNFAVVVVAVVVIVGPTCCSIVCSNTAWQTSYLFVAFLTDYILIVELMSQDFVCLSVVGCLSVCYACIVAKRYVLSKYWYCLTNCHVGHSSDSWAFYPIGDRKQVLRTHMRLYRFALMRICCIFLSWFNLSSCFSPQRLRCYNRS